MKARRLCRRPLAGSGCLAEDVDRLFEGSRAADGIEHEEVVEGPVEADARRAHAGLVPEQGFELALAMSCGGSSSVCLVMGLRPGWVTAQRPSRGGRSHLGESLARIPGRSSPSPGDASGSAPFELRQAVPEPLARAVE